MATDEVRVETNDRVEANDPFYLHPSDNPGMVLVTPPFGGKNFGEWRRSILIALSAKNKLGFLNGDIKKPDPPSPRLMLWRRCNDMVTAWILNSLSPEIKRSVIYMDTAQAIWRSVESRYGKIGGTQLFAIKREISRLEQGTTSFATYFNKMKALWDELDNVRTVPACTCGAAPEMLKFEQNERLVDLLMGLNESYLTARGSVLMMDPLPNLDRVYSLMTQEENQREAKLGSDVVESISSHVHTQAPPKSGSAVDAISMFVKTQSNPKGGNSGNSQGGATSSKNNNERKPLFCTNCKKTNHTVDRCFFLIGFPAGYGKDKDKKPVADGKFAGTATQGGSSDFTPSQLAQIMSLLQSAGVGSQGKQPIADDFAGFSGSYDEGSCEDW